MRRRGFLAGLSTAPALTAALSPRQALASERTPILDSLAIHVTPVQNRQFSYTDKVSGYFHGRTHLDANPDWFNGWNIATKRVLHDYELNVDGFALARGNASEVVVSPHQIKRVFQAATEVFSMLEGLAVLVMRLSNVKGQRIGVSLKGGLTDTGALIAGEGVWFVPSEAPGSCLLIAPIDESASNFDPRLGLSCVASAGGFFFIHAASKLQALGILRRVRRSAAAMLTSRARRLEALISGNRALDAGHSDRTKALLWMRLTADQLVMKQLGTGIYAGLPWFNDYWGRDTFISIAGTLFVTGQYDVAVEVFESFAALQDQTPTSKTFGRVPNRARPDSIEYNSADGTPRFIITLAELIRCSGKVGLAKRLWPHVKRAVKGLLANNVDALGFITHDDADTWMDAKEKGLRAWSPRGNRAIDVQALWLDAFAAIMQMSEWAGAGKGSYQMPNSWGDDNAPKMEFLGPDAAFLEQVYYASKKLTLAIPTHFIDPATGNVADHLKVSGERNMQVRPNLFMAMMQVRTDAVPNASQSDKDAHAQMRWTRRLWEQLVYPWGVATLSQDDPDFYPYHEHWHYYHKDAAYHNGTVWPWLNGDAIERMVQFGQIDLAWQLFENMNRQALIEGAVGSLAECADALPVEGANWTRRTGTFLQAWSNGEHLRVWHRSFLGITASPMTGNIMVRPALPDRITDVKDTIHFGRGTIEGVWNVGGPGRWTFAFSNVRGRLIFYHPDFPHNGLHADVVSGHRVEIVQSGVEITLTHFNRNGKIVATDSAFSMAHDSPGVAASAQQVLWRQERVARDAIFPGLDFCKPRLQQGLKSLSVYHDPPLTY